MTFAFAPSTYTVSTRSFLTSSDLGGSTFTSASATGTPYGFKPAVGYTATDAQLILSVVPPRCVLSGNAYTCTGPADPANDLTQTLTFNGTTTATTTPGFGISTASGDAIQIAGPGSFADANHAQITGAANGFNATNNGTGAFTLTTNGVTTGTGGFGITATNLNTATDLTISAATVTGNGGISASNQGTGSTLLTVTGTAIGTNRIAASAYNSSNSTGDLTVTVANALGARGGINADQNGRGALIINSAGQIDGGMGNAIGAFAGSLAKSLTVSAAQASGGGGIYAKNYGLGATLVTASGLITGTSSDGINVVTARLIGSGNISPLTVTAASVTGAINGIYAYNPDWSARGFTM